MKSPTHPSISHGRSALVAAVIAVALGPTAGFAQAGSSQRTPRAETSTTINTQSTTAENPDNQATREINEARGEISPQARIGAGAPTGRDTVTNKDKLSWMDRRFVTKAADDGKAEVQIATLAAQRASNAEVKSYAEKLVDAHSKVNSELSTIAGQKNVKIDNDDDKDRAYKRLSKKTGMDFDQEFVEHMIDEHEKCIKMFEKAAKDAKDSDVRSFASMHLDHLRQHLQEAQGLRQTLVPTGRMDNSGRSTPAGPTSTDTSTRSSSEATTTPTPIPDKEP